ncbi:hypothetical protein V1J52_06895 [Streptomyces sp. TRM 70351]|uniref:SecDF P1 head subdomain-containing protein n=1 Tax=Streptomyces sp. TRM 70351 TaxID=3116552 RepID=UPI002E7AD771|nr:hypothetical protein [Streptomyces sp. TRM 70351]MEE1927922.1 hypothetical protein [Streptomyces sp. TRM 70351]
MQGNTPRQSTSSALLILAAAFLAVAGCTSGGGGGGDGSGKPEPGAPAPSASATPVPVGQPIRFHPVEQVVTGPCPTGTGQWVADTTGDANKCYGLLDAAAMTVTETLRAEAAYDKQMGTWLVRVELSAADADRFADLTARVVGEAPPRNQVAVVLQEPDGDRLLSAPAVYETLTGGTVQIIGSFGQEGARDLARRLGGG